MQVSAQELSRRWRGASILAQEYLLANHPAYFATSEQRIKQFWAARWLERCPGFEPSSRNAATPSSKACGMVGVF